MSEEKEKKKQRSVFDQFSNIEIGLSKALETQNQIMHSPALTEAVRQATNLVQSFEQIAGSLSFMESLTKMMKQYDEVTKVFAESSAGLKLLNEYQSQINRLVDDFGRIGEMVKPLDISFPKLEKELVAIPPQNNTLVRSLLRQIEFLEKELVKERAKSKEKDNKINKLLALLEEKQKELRQQYVS